MHPQKLASLFSFVSDYPDPDIRELRAVIAGKENVSPENILIGNGAAELIFIIAAALLQNEDVLIVEPAFSEYRKACELFSKRISSYVLKEEENWELNVEELKTALSGKKRFSSATPTIRQAKYLTGKHYWKSFKMPKRSMRLWFWTKHSMISPWKTYQF